jgi:membrane fusion protein (multidrug efflux system)
VLGAVLLAALAGGAWYGQHWWTVGRFTVSTDDAYVRASNTTLAAKVSGYVSKIDVDDNAYVHAGDVIATIDDGDYRLAVEAARDKVHTQQASVARIGQQVVAQGANVEQAQAQVASAQAGAKRAQSELDRQQALAARDYASKQTLESALANRDQANAAVQSAQAALDSATANVDVLKAQQQEATRTVDELKTALAKAERDLSFAVIRAPIDGVLGNRAMQVGDYVTPGQRLASLVPLDDIYIDANFKETQLAGLRAGQKVDVAVDALPDSTIQGTVTSLAPASGSVFSLLPPDNATGNFTKIVQRVPVRIRVPADVAAERVLRPGMSVVVSVNTKGSAASTPTPVASRGVARAVN